MKAQALFRLLVVSGALMGATECGGPVGDSTGSTSAESAGVRTLADGGAADDDGGADPAGGTGGGVQGW